MSPGRGQMGAGRWAGADGTASAATYAATGCRECPVGLVAMSLNGTAQHHDAASHRPRSLVVLVRTRESVDSCDGASERRRGARNPSVYPPAFGSTPCFRPQLTPSAVHHVSAPPRPTPPARFACVGGALPTADRSLSGARRNARRPTGAATRLSGWWLRRPRSALARRPCTAH